MAETQTANTSSRICPYAGLRAFSPDEALFFKGRDLHIEKIVGLIEEKKYLMLTGASGEGKSSLIYAGLIPNAKAGFIKAKFNNWVIADFRPERQPLENMIGALAEQLDYDNHDSLRASLRLGYSALVELYRNSSRYVDLEGAEWRNADPEHRKELKRNAANLLILVDQFEEFFTNTDNYNHGEPSPDAKTVVNLLIETNRIAREQDLPIYIVSTMRSDYIGYCTAFSGLPELIGLSHYFVPRLNRNEIFQVIDEPAILSGNKISPRLVARLLNDLKEGTDILPVLQHALYQIWNIADQSGHDEMDLIHYAKVGGMPSDELTTEDQEDFDNWFGHIPEYKKTLMSSPSLTNVLNTHADTLYETAHEYFNEKNPGNPLTKEQAQKIVKISFTALTKIDDNKAVRNRMSVKEVTDIINDPEIDSHKVIGVLNIFKDPGNTLIRPYSTSPTESSAMDWASYDMNESTILDITHEALIRNWYRLAEWAKTEYEGVDIFGELSQQLNRWLENEKSTSFLLSPGQLNYFKSWYDANEPSGYWMHRYFKEEEVDTQVFDKYSELQKQAHTLEKEVKDFLIKSYRNISRSRRLAAVALVVISILFVVSIVAFFIANTERGKAIIAEKITRSNEVAMKSISKISADPTIAYHFAEEAYKVHPTSLAKQAIMASYVNPPFYNLLQGHKDIVMDVNFSPDDQLAVSASDDNNAIIWNMKGEKISVLEGHNDAVFKASFSPNGMFVVTASDDRTARIWDLKGNMLKVLSGHHYALNSAVFSPDGRYVLTSSVDRTARIWDLEGNQIQLMEHAGKVNKAEFTSDGQRILTLTDWELLQIWDLENNVIQDFREEGFLIDYSKFNQKEDGIIAIVTPVDAEVNPKCKFILWNLDGDKVNEFELENRTENGIAHNFYSFDVSPDETKLVAGTDDRMAFLWDLNNPTIKYLGGHISPLSDVKFSPEGNYILTITDGFVMKLWDREGRLLNSLKPNDFTNAVMFSADERYLVSAHNRANVRLWNLEKLESSILEGHDEFIWTINYSNSGEQIITASWDNTARIWSKSGKLLTVLKGHEDKLVTAKYSANDDYIVTAADDYTVRYWKPNGENYAIGTGHTERIMWLDMSSDGKHVVTASSDGSAIIWDNKGNLVQALQSHRSGLRHAVFSSDGQMIITSSADNTARIWNLNGEELMVLEGHNSGIFQSAFSEDDKYAATASDDGTARIWDLSDISKVVTCEGHTSFLMSISFSKDGKYLATASNDQTARIWDLNGNSVAVMKGHTEMINRVSFSPNDQYLLTACDDGTARLWDRKGNEINVYKGHNGGVQDAAFSKDGTQVLTSSADGTARIWPLFVENVIEKINESKKNGYIWMLSPTDRQNLGLEK